MLLKVAKEIKTAFILFFLFTLITGILYPMIVTGLAQWIFPFEANGSFLVREGKTIGSLLIGQSFTSSHSFWGRPSATPSFPYNASHSSGSNLGLSNPLLTNSITQRVDVLRKLDPLNELLIPIDLVTTSASGLDPDISPLSAFYQVSRIAKERGIPEELIQQLIQKAIKKRVFGILGEQSVNVLLLNLALDDIEKTSTLSKEKP